MTDNFKFSLVEEFGGYNSARDKTTLSKAFLIRGSKNVYKKVSGTIASRPGLKRRGSADSTDAGVKSSWEWQTSKGTTRPLRVCNNKLEVESDIATASTYVWYELFATGAVTTSLATTLTRFVFDTWWHPDEKKDRLLMVRGDDKILHWSGGIAKIGTPTANTIPLSDTSLTWAGLGFATQTAGEKKIVINSTEYTYTGGETTNTLTGVTPDPSGEAANSVAIQAVIIQDDAPIDGYVADFIKKIGNQVLVGSYSSRTIYISADIADSGGLVPLDFANAGDLISGDPDTIVLDDPAKGIGEQDNNAAIFAGNSDLYLVKLNENVPWPFADPGIGSNDRYVAPGVYKKTLPNFNATLGHEFIGNYSNSLVWLDQKNQLRSLSDIANISRPIPVHLSLPVKEELSEDDFTGGHLRVIDDTIYITAPNNGRDWMYVIRETLTDNGEITSEKFWNPPQIRGISRFAVISGVVYGHSNTQPQIYQVWDTAQWFDDNPSDEPIPYNCTARFAYRNTGNRFKMNQFDKYWVEGYMPEGVELSANLYFEYQGAESIQMRTVNDNANPAKFWTGTPYPSLGDTPLGDNPLGDGIIPEGGEQEQVPKFRKIVNVTPVISFEHTIEIYSVSADSRWEIISLGPNMIESDQVPAFLTG